MGFFGLFVLNATEDTLTINIFATLLNNSVTDLTDQNYKASWSVVVGGIGPDHENHVHDGHKEIWDFSEVFTKISKLIEQGAKSLEIFEVLIGFCSSSLDLFLKFAEWTSVCGFVLFKELKYLLDPF
jgi:hypothetical protein